MDSDRLARVEEQVKWMAPRVERIETKLDQVIERYAFNWGKILGFAAFAAFVATLLVELARAR